MDYLEEKYKRNCLTPKELEELQRKVREMSDGQLEDRLFKGWQEDILDDSSVSAERLAILKRKVDKSIFPKYRTVDIVGTNSSCNPTSNLCFCYILFLSRNAFFVKWGRFIFYICGRTC